MTPAEAAWSDDSARPVVRQVVLDCSDPRALAEFYRQLLGSSYRPGDEPPQAGEADPQGGDWLVLRPPGAAHSAGCGIAFQFTEGYQPPVWGPGTPSEPGVQQQMLHLDMTVPDVAALVSARDRATDLGATVLHDRSQDPDEPLYVFADPMGHPFCIFVG